MTNFWMWTPENVCINIIPAKVLPWAISTWTHSHSSRILKFKARHSVERAYSVSTAGDFNGDGIPDTLIGAPGHASDFGAAYVVYGQEGRYQLLPCLSR